MLPRLALAMHRQSCRDQVYQLDRSLAQPPAQPSHATASHAATANPGTAGCTTLHYVFVVSAAVCLVVSLFSIVVFCLPCSFSFFVCCFCLLSRFLRFAVLVLVVVLCRFCCFLSRRFVVFDCFLMFAVLVLVVGFVVSAASVSSFPCVLLCSSVCCARSRGFSRRFGCFLRQ